MSFSVEHTPASDWFTKASPNRPHVRGPSKLALTLFLCVLSGVTTLLPPSDVHAVPAFARKYDMTCGTCHTRFPRLNPYGERFLENGYQLPGTEDGGISKKTQRGEASLDEVTNYLSFRLNGEPVRSFSSQGQVPATSGTPQSRVDIAFPSVFSLFAAGTLAKNVGVFAEMESNFEEGMTGPERVFMTFNNLGRHDLAHLRIGRFDPSAFFSFATLRQQFSNIPGEIDDKGPWAHPTINRISLSPAAFAGKFSGLFTRDGTAIQPFDPALFNSPAALGADIHGRPFGDWFLYQVGVLNGSQEQFGDSNRGKDWYAMIRFDYARSHLMSASLSGFTYVGNSNAKTSDQTDINWHRYGVAATMRYHMVDLYAAFTIDQIRHLPVTMAQNFDATATGLTVEADVLVTDRLLLSARYDRLDAGGLIDQRQSTSMLGLQGKYYLRSNISLSMRNDLNLQRAGSGTTAARAFRNGLFMGADLTF
jgi:hypothetical protein